VRWSRCKCGKLTSYGSMPTPRCYRCGDCGSDLAGAPDQHQEPIPHDFVTRYDQNTGKPFRVCRRCMYREDQLTVAEGGTAEAAT
jgi:hypothetical protein